MTFENLLRSHQQINDLTRSLIGRPAFEDLHVKYPDPASPEAGFMRATSWLYCLYFEAGRVSLTFLRKLGEVYTILERTRTENHIQIVRCLRTELHHNLGFVDSDLEARSTAERWRRNVCGSAIPRDDGQWRRCYDQLVCDAAILLSCMEDIVRRIENDSDMFNERIDEWCRRLDRSWPAATFDPIVDDVKSRLGRGALNTVGFRQRHIERWRKQLESFDDGFDFSYEVTRLVEKSFLDDAGLLLPITGRDIMDIMGIAPGPQIGQLLEIARKYYENTLCNKDELLTYLQGVQP